MILHSIPEQAGKKHLALYIVAFNLELTWTPKLLFGHDCFEIVSEWLLVSAACVSKSQV